MAAEAPGIHPQTLAMMAWQTMGLGNSVWRVAVEGVGYVLYPASEFEVSGGVSPSTWRYTIELPRPTGEPEVRHIAADGIVHCRYEPSTDAPWLGVSALTRAGMTAEQLAYIEARLRDASKVKVAYVVPMPSGASLLAMTSAKGQ